MDCDTAQALLWWRQMLSRRSRNSIPILLGLVLASDAQNLSPWHGRIIGIENFPDQQTQSLTYLDLKSAERGILTADSGLTYLLDASSATVYVSRLKVTDHGEPGRSLQIIQLNDGQTTKIRDYPAVCYACPACRGCRGATQMALSPDGRYVFTLLERIQEHHQTPPPGQIATDDDASFAEHVVLTYDSSIGRFLDDSVTTVLGSSTGYRLLPSSEPESFEILQWFYRGVRLVRYRFPGSRSMQNGVVLGELAAPESDAQVVQDPSNSRTLLFSTDGRVIEAKGQLKQIGVVSPLPPARRMFSPALSGNGKLLFIPTGPANNFTNKYAPTSYIDQIDVYDAASLTRLRSLHLQRPLLQVVPNQDGSMLYAGIPDRPSIVILNAESLWQEEEHLVPAPIRQIALLP